MVCSARRTFREPRRRLRRSRVGMRSSRSFSLVRPESHVARWLSTKRNSGVQVRLVCCRSLIDLGMLSLGGDALPEVPRFFRQWPFRLVHRRSRCGRMQAAWTCLGWSHSLLFDALSRHRIDRSLLRFFPVSAGKPYRLFRSIVPWKFRIQLFLFSFLFSFSFLCSLFSSIN